MKNKFSALVGLFGLSLALSGAAMMYRGGSPEPAKATEASAPHRRTPAIYRKWGKGMTSSTNSPGTTDGAFATSPFTGTISWTNPNNAEASDSVYATAALVSADSKGLRLSNFGFTVPSGATINGIIISIKRHASSTHVLDRFLRIIKSDGSVGSTELAATLTAWPTSDGVATYGSSSNLLGETWAYTDINNANFGVAVSATGTGVGGTASIDYVSIQVFWTPAANNSAGFFAFFEH